MVLGIQYGNETYPMAEEVIKAINQSALALLQTLELNARYEAAVQEATRLTGAQYGTILIHKKGVFERVFSTVPAQFQTNPRRRGYTYKTYMSSEIHIMDPDTLKVAHKDLFDKGVRSLVLIPLAIKEQRVGVLALQSNNEKHFTPLQMQLITLFGTLVTLAIRNAEFFDQTKKSITSRDLFISLASHELKTPLTTISVYADMLAKKINSKQMPSENAIEIVRSEAKRLKHIINELLEFNHIASGQLRYKWKDVNILDVMKKSIINFKSINPEYKILVENTIPRAMNIIQGDPEKLQQAFSNILNNSAKFSHPHIPIIIKLEMKKNNMCISFTDFGKGIRKSEQDKIFSEFYKAQGNTKDGMGLGLYLVRRIIEKHKGKIELSSKINQGTNILIKLPRKLYD